MLKENYLSWLVPIEISKSLKEIGFDKPCIFSYSEGIGVTTCLRSGAGEEPLISDFVVGGNTPNSPFIDLPTWEQVFEWFREKGLHSRIEVLYTNVEYDKKSLKLFNKFEKVVLEKPIALYHYCIGHKAIGTFFFKRRNSTEVFCTESFKSYKKCRKALVYELIEKYKNQIDINEKKIIHLN